MQQAPSLETHPVGSEYAVTVLSNTASLIAAAGLTDELMEPTLGVSAFVSIALTAFCGIACSFTYGLT